MLNSDESLSSILTGKTYLLPEADAASPADRSPRQIADPRGRYSNTRHIPVINGNAKKPVHTDPGYWAWKHYLRACQTQWSPEQINLQKDLNQWQDRHALTADERSVVQQNLGFLEASMAGLGQRGVTQIHRKLSNPECRQYLLRQAYEEGLHRHALWQIRQTLQLATDHDECADTPSPLAWLEHQTQPLANLQFNTEPARQAAR